MAHEPRCRYSEPEVRRGPVDLGTVSVTMRTCKRNGSWRVLDLSVRQPAKDLVLTVEGSRITRVAPQAGPLGYRVVHRRTGDGKVELAALRCSREPRELKDGIRKTVTALLEVPLPIGYATSVGVYAASKVLPEAPEDRYWCARIGSVAAIPFGITEAGRPFLRWSSLPGRKVQRTATTTYQQPCPSVKYCADVYDEIVRMQKPA